MKTVRHFLLALCSLLMLWVPQGHAEDIDIYSGGAVPGGAPNVLIILDNAASFSASTPACSYADGSGVASMSGQVAGTEQCALYNTINSLTTNSDGTARVNLGLMVYSTTGIAAAYPGAGCAASNDGACLLRAITPMDAAGKLAWLAMIKAWNIDDIKANNQGNAMAMQEAWAYYAGKTGASGRNYSGIAPGAGCQKNFVIYIGNAFRNNTTPGDNGDPSGLLAAAPPIANQSATPNPDTTAITIPSATYGLPAGVSATNPSGFSCGFGNPYSMPSHSNTSGLFADEWARYMKNTDIFGGVDESQGITTFTLGALSPTCNAQYPALLSSMANAGGGLYFASDASDASSISDSFSSILNQIQSTNSVFASASLPVSVNSEGTFLNQIFLGMFRPDANASPRWVGNLKQFQLVKKDPTISTSPLVLGDSLGKPALNSKTGFITPASVSYWTYKDTSVAPDDVTVGGFFKNNLLGTFVNDTEKAALAFDRADGEVVEKGGVAQQIRKAILTTTYPSTGRKIYTYCPSGASCQAALSHSSNAFTVANTDVLSTTPSLSPSNISRSGPVATVTTPSAHGLIAGDTVNIVGASPNDYNGTKTVVAPVTATTFTFAANDFPPFPATGTYTAAAPATPQPVTLARVGTLVTATSAAHGYTNGDSISIAGANQTEYNGTFVIGGVTANTFTFTVTETPPLVAGGGTSARETGSAAAKAPRNIESIANSGVLRAGGSTTVTVKTTTPHGASPPNKVTIAGVTDASGNSVYNGSGITITSAPTATTYTFTTTVGPATPATGTITASKVSTVQNITALTRVGTKATATVAGHGFADGTVIAIGGTAGPNESAYLGSYTISGVTANTFDYTVTLSPTTPATGTITVSKAGVSDRTALINWVRGEDNFGDEKGPGGSVTVRPSVHGDVLHSRPVVINYVEGSGGTNDKLVVFYGSNDGVFRAVNGSQTDSIGAVPPGGELWGLVLKEHYGQLNRQRINAPELAIPPSAPSGSLPKDYFVDGSAGVFQQLNTDGTVAKAYLYLTMRRGGRFIYALDVTDPESPQFLWKKSFLDTGFSELGQTWSRPRVTLVQGYAKPVLVFGAGYDPAEDSEPPGVNSMGRGVFIVDAENGDLVWKATATTDPSASCVTVAAVVVPTAIPAHSHCKVPEMKYAVPSDIAFKDRDSDGYTDRMYFGDVGGNMWRVDLITSSAGTAATKSNLPEHWRVTKLAALGCDVGAPPCVVSGTQPSVVPRKFFFPPSVISVGATGAAGSYEAVVAGSGDREHPLISSAPNSSHFVQNRFYMIKDDVSTAHPERSILNAASILGKDFTSEFTLKTEATLFKSFKGAAISGHQRVTTDVMTITTSAPHGFIRGEPVVIDGANPASLDGHFTITGVTSTTFTFASIGAAGTFAAATGNATVQKFKNATVTNFERVVTDVMTVTTSSAHSFLKGQTVVIENSDVASLNGAHTITTVPTPTTFSFKLTGAISAIAAATGDATVAVAFDSTNTEPGFYGYLALGEKAVNAPVTVSGTAFFGTNRPVAASANTCVSNLGQARGYAFSPFSGEVSSVVFEGGGLPPSPVTGVVDVDNSSGTEFVRFCIGCGGGLGGDGSSTSALENTDPFLAVPKKPRRTYWYRQ